VSYGQNDDARRYEEQRRADEARRYEEQRRQERQRQDDVRREEQKRYEQQKADEDRRYYERKLETERQNRVYADGKREEVAQSDARYRQSQQEADREHRDSEDEYHQNLKQQQDRFRAQENERFEQDQREGQSGNTTGHAWVDDPAFAGLFKFGLLCLAGWGIWAGLGRFWLLTQQWQTYDIPQRWVGQFYRTILDIPLNAVTNLVAANMDFVVQIADSKVWIIGAGILAVIVALMILGMLATSKFARRLFGIGALVFLTPALLGGLWLVLPPDSAANARAWIKSQPFYTAQVNGAEIDASVVALTDWLACSTYQQPAFPAVAVNTLVRGKVLVPLPVKEQVPPDQRPRVSVYKPYNADFSLAGQIVREIRVTEGAKPTSLEVDFVGKPIRVAAVNSQYRLPVVFYPDGPEGGKFAYTDGHSGYRESPRGRVVGYENVLRADKSGFTVRCPG
jgi:hypothetical protein